MEIKKRCLRCGAKIKGSISVKNDRYIQKIDCDNCGYSNNRDAGSAVLQELKIINKNVQKN